MSTQDKLQDVFPINFQFVQGELADATKFTGWVKQTDTAFSNMGSAIGDPWEYQSHLHPLSPEKLAQTSLSRFMGPSDWVSPAGSCWNEAPTGAIDIQLDGNRNSWSLGFPLVKSTELGLTSQIATTITTLVINTDFVVTTGSSYFTTEKTDIKDIAALGDFHINCYTGVITIYEPPAVDIVIRIYADKFNMFGPGVPWGTSNVIPTWNQSSICTVTEPAAAVGGVSTYLITLPNVEATTREETSRWLKGALETYAEGAFGSVSDVYYNVYAPGSSAKHRLPYSLTSAFSNGERIPDGYMYLWDEDNSRIIPNTTFWYIDGYSVQVTAPEGGVPTGMKVRVLVSGTSLAEATSYLMTTTRYNRHVGLTDSQDSLTMMYTSPLSHDHLTDRYSGPITYGITDMEKFQFRESDYPINPHPQYLHRAGWMADDSDGNSGNAMRGNLVFTGTDTGFPLGQDGDLSGCKDSTYGIYWGGPDTTYGTSLSFEGGENATSNRIGFGIFETGANPISPETFGALTFKPYNGAPLYLQGTGAAESPTTYQYHGAFLGFDLGRRYELNYIKLMSGSRSGSKDYVNMPVNDSQAAFASALDITPSLSNRLYSGQIREFRFRGGAYISTATNTDDSLGGTNTQGAGNEITDFYYHFTSPGMIGADFINVYSNAIFFSEEGDGKKTSFTDNAQNWLDNNLPLSFPTGIYYEPPQGGNSGVYNLWVKTTGGSQAEVANIGYDNILLSSTAIGLTSSGDTTLNADSFYINSGTDGELKAIIGSSSGSNPNSYCYLTKTAANIVKREGSSWISYVSLGTNAVIAADAGDVQISADSDVEIEGDYVFIEAKATTGDPRMKLTGTNILIDTSDSAGQGLKVPALYTKQTGATRDDLYVDNSGFLGIVPSSAKLKKDIADMKDVSWMYELRPVTFKWKKDSLGKETEYGLIAEEVAKINSRFVNFDEDNNPKSVPYTRFISPLIKAVQDQKQEIESLKKETEWLKKELDKKTNKRVKKK
jgi:hypothetical protein